MQRLVDLFDVGSEEGGAKPEATSSLKTALWNDLSREVADTSVGQFQPGSLGGVNSSTGTGGPGSVNAWDFVLMMEGSVVFTSRATKRFAPSESAGMSAPFAIRAQSTGYATPGTEKDQRGEQWMPIWKNPATVNDVAALFSEARLQHGRKSASRPIDAARAISRLGVARGITDFIRYGYLERNGQSTLAVPLGRIHVRQHPLSALTDDLTGWMDRLGRRARDSHAPARLIQSERSLSDAVFNTLTRDDPRNHSPLNWQSVLRAAAGVELIQASGTAIEAGPIPPLSTKWIAAINDQSCEVRLAVALASAAAPTRKGSPRDSVRCHGLPIEMGAFPKFKTSDKRLVNDPRVVMHGRDFQADLIALVNRRLIESSMRSERRLSLVSPFGCSAGLSDLAAFIDGTLDLKKIDELSRALMAVRWERWNDSDRFVTNTPFAIPDEAWLMLRLSNLAFPLDGDRDIPAEPGIIRQLTAGDPSRAIETAIRRMRSAGIRPPVSLCPIDPNTARYWAAALAFPITSTVARKAVGIIDPRTIGLKRV